MFTVWILTMMVVLVVAKPPQVDELHRMKRQQDFMRFGQRPQQGPGGMQFGGQQGLNNQRFPNNPFLNNQNNQGFNQGSNQGFNQGSNQGSNQAFPNNPFLNEPVEIDDDFSFLNPQTTVRTPSTSTTRRTNNALSTLPTNNGLPNNNGLPTTTPNAVPGAETPRTICEQQCLTTPQYNPVCGSDGNTYTNQAQLNCAVGCGKVVRLSHIGQCTARRNN